jgi:hypothetical protein
VKDFVGHFWDHSILEQQLKNRILSKIKTGTCKGATSTNWFRIFGIIVSDLLALLSLIISLLTVIF